MNKKLITAAVIIFGLSLPILAQSLRIGSGAGYKQPVMKLINHLKQTGFDIDPIFGNMKQVCSQANAGEFSVVIGDKDFLDNKSGLKFSKFTTLGKGILVLVSNKELSSPQDLVKLEKVAMPQPQKAIYGIRAKQFLQKSGLDKKLENKLIEVATVPQVSAYIFSGDVDAGFVNLTEAIAQKGKFKTVIKIDESMYEPVLIVAGELENCEKDTKCNKFISDLTSPYAKQIFAEYGLE